MDIKELLKTIGLNKYESSAYLEIIRKGVVEASEIYKDAQIPFGKIYEVLTSLEQIGLIEIQNSRPKKYKAINPEIAYENFLKSKQENYDNRIDSLGKNLNVIKKEVMKDFNKNSIEKKFWKSAIEDEALDLMELSFAEVKEELVIFTDVGNEKNSNFDERMPIMIDLVAQLLEKGISIKVLLDKEMSEIMHKRYLTKLQNFDNLEIKISNIRSINTFFILDKKEVLFTIANPLNVNDILGIIKIEDIQLLNKLYDHFEILWNEGKFSNQTF